MKKEKLTFLKPKKGNSLGQWLVEEGISAGFPSPADDFKEVRISLDKELVKNKVQIDENITKKEFLVVDARSKDRFEGKVKEPREGLRSGSILNSKCLPFSEVLNKEGTFKDKNELKNLFKSTLGTTNENDTVFSCGSGVTACVLAFAYYLINDKYLPKIYDGSWAEYGKL